MIYHPLSEGVLAFVWGVTPAFARDAILVTCNVGWHMSVALRLAVAEPAGRRGLAEITAP
jgi:hypothetical protein